MEELFETKSINNDVVNLSDLIADKILNEAPKQKMNVSKITGALYVEGGFIQELYGEIKGIDKLQVHYILYDFENFGEYNQWLKTVSTKDESKHYNCYSDYVTKEIQIVSAYVNNKILSDFAESILHEITHLYQYGEGMQKQVNLYDNVIKMCLNNDVISSAVARTVYYTFKHEQDAMVHQFYGYLLQNGINDDFEKLIIDNSEYGNANKSLKIVNQYKEKAIEAIKELGFNVEQYNKRIHYGYKRFKQKLYNAYLLYSQQKNSFDITNESKTFELNLKSQIFFHNFLMEAMKKHGDVDLNTEIIYSF